jgi:hypothetical protein
MITGVDQIRKDGGYGEQDKRDGQVRPDAKVNERLLFQRVWMGIYVDVGSGRESSRWFR